MADVLTPEQRRFNMSRVRSKDTRPEMLLRKGLHARGLRFRLHRKDLPGCPDLVLPKYHAVIFAHGCFWHGHNCPMFKLPTTNSEFWSRKVLRNRTNDSAVLGALHQQGWRVMVVWECVLRGRARWPFDEVLDTVMAWLEGSGPFVSLSGKWAEMGITTDNMVALAISDSKPLQVSAAN